MTDIPELVLPKVCTIDTNKWCRGGMNGRSQLLNNEGNMCCLGFLANQCGISKKYLEGKSYPCNLCQQMIGNIPLLNQKNKYHDWCQTELSMALTEVNDNNMITDIDRKSELTQLFKEKLGVKLVFVDGAVPT